MSKSSKALHPIFASLFAFAFLANTSISEATTLEKIQTCRAALWEPTKKQIQFAGLFDTQDIPYSHDPAIAEVDRNSQSGVITVKRIHVTWASNFHSPGAMDFMGSPQWIFHVFGQEAADWMGVRMVNDTTMTIFDGERAKNIVNKINQQMIKMELEPLPINFYQLPPDQNLQSLIPYLRLFTESGNLPFSGGFYSLVHDFTYHFSSIIIPPVVVKLLRIQTRYLLKFVDHISSLSFQTQTQTEHVKRILNDALDRQGHYIDRATALYPLLLKGNWPDFSTSLVENHFYTSYSEGKSSEVHIGRVIEAVRKNWPPETEEQDIVVIKALLKEELERFSFAHQGDTDFNFSFDPEDADLAGALVQRRDEVVRAIKVLSTK